MLKLPCNHECHFECIQQWWQDKKVCPNSNVEITSQEVSFQSLIGIKFKISYHPKMCNVYQMHSFQYYSFGMMNFWNCQLNFIILETNFAICCTNYTWIIKQFHCTSNQLHKKNSTNFTTCSEQFHDLESIFTTSKNQFHKLYISISQREVHHV